MPEASKSQQKDPVNAYGSNNLEVSCLKTENNLNNGQQNHQIVRSKLFKHSGNVQDIFDIFAVSFYSEAFCIIL